MGIDNAEAHEIPELKPETGGVYPGEARMAFNGLVQGRFAYMLAANEGQGAAPQTEEDDNGKEMSLTIEDTDGYFTYESAR